MKKGNILIPTMKIDAESILGGILKRKCHDCEMLEAFVPFLRLRCMTEGFFGGNTTQDADCHNTHEMRNGHSFRFAARDRAYGTKMPRL